MIKKLTTITATLFCLAAHAQLPAPAAVPMAFPEDAQLLTASQLDERLRGHVFTATLADGTGWRLDYKATGYAFANISNGASDSGKWRAEDGKMCIDYRGRFPAGCSEIRASAQALYLKRGSTGEIVTLHEQ